MVNINASFKNRCKDNALKCQITAAISKKYKIIDTMPPYVRLSLSSEHEEVLEKAPQRLIHETKALVLTHM